MGRLRRYLKAVYGKPMPLLETWDMATPEPMIWPRTADNLNAYAPNQEMPLVVTPDFAFWEYRVRAGLSWADVTGQWPQPRWRTRLDRLYYRLTDEADAERTARS